MDYVEGRGVCCGNEVYFDYVDGEVVMTMYRDMPGVRSDRLKPNVIKTFVPAQWGEINEYLMGTLDRVEGVFNDVEEEAEEAEEAESSPLFQQIVPETSDEEEEGDEPDISPDDAGRVPESELTESEKELLASGGSVIHNERLPSMVSVPKMTEDDKEEVEERDEELADVTEREE
ncbi:hypothetical protein LCGC14_2571830, partial [marine sediment metagenome]